MDTCVKPALTLISSFLGSIGISLLCSFRTIFGIGRRAGVAIAALAVLGTYLLLQQSKTSRREELANFQRNYDELAFISAEISTEAGPDVSDYANAIELYREILKNHIAIVNSRKPRDVILIDGLDKALELLSSKAIDKVSMAREIVSTAAKTLNYNAREMHEALGKRRYVYSANKSPVTDRTTMLTEQALEEFYDSLLKLKATSSTSNVQLQQAKATCLASRKASAYYRFVAPEFLQGIDATNRVAEFADRVTQAQQLIAKLTPDYRDEPLADYAESLGRRAAAIHATLEANFAQLDERLMRDSDKCRKHK